MIYSQLYLITTFDPHATYPSINRSYLCSLPTQTMNNPYLYPEDAPWTDEYQELKEIRSQRNYPRAFDDEEEFLEALYNVI